VPAWQPLTAIKGEAKPLHAETPEQKLDRERAERAAAFAYVHANSGSPRAWAILGLLQHRLAGDKEAMQHVAEALQSFDDRAGLGFAARYEYARLQLQQGNLDDARALFLDSAGIALDEGWLPPIDADFRTALGKGFDAHIRQTAARLLAENRCLSLVALASQVRPLNEGALADALIEQAVAGTRGKERLTAALAGIEQLRDAGQLKQAETLLDTLLTDKELSQDSALWHLAASLTGRDRPTGRAVEYLDRALDLEYRQLPDVINLQQIRRDYGRLLHGYREVLAAMATLDRQPPKEMVAKVVRAADRWRSLDPDGTAACQAAARILKSLGATELAWEYLTTPLALRPTEAAPHLQMARALRADGDHDLADRAFAAAFAAEPANAEILWERALALRQAGKFTESRVVLRQLADGTWHQRHQGIQQEARWLLGGR